MTILEDILRKALSSILDALRLPGAKNQKWYRQLKGQVRGLIKLIREEMTKRKP